VLAEHRPKVLARWRG